MIKFCLAHPHAPLLKDYEPDGKRVFLDVRCSICNSHCGTTRNPLAPPERSATYKSREFRLTVQEISDEVEAISLIEQVFQLYPKVDRVAIATYFQRRLVAE